MSRVVSLDRRLREVERRALVSPFGGMSDAELEASYLETCSALAECGGVAEDFRDLPLHRQLIWLQTELARPAS